MPVDKEAGSGESFPASFLATFAGNIDYVAIESGHIQALILLPGL